MPFGQSRLTIAELEGGEGRTVVLERWDLMSDPAVFAHGGRLRTKVTFYPGNPVPTVQVLGTEEAPINIRGTFDDIRFGAGHAVEQRDALNAIRRGGRIVRVEYEEKAFFGLVEEALFQERDLHRISYDATLIIMGLAEDSQGAIAAGATFPSNPLTRLRNKIGSLANTVLTAPQALGTKLLGELQDRFSIFQDDVLAGIIEGGIFQAQIAVDQALLNRTTGALARAGVTGRAWIGTLDALAFEPQILSRGVGDIQISSWVKNTRLESAQTVDLTITTSRELSKVKPDTVKKIVQARAGDTLQSIAAKHLGTQEAWQRIADFNGISSTDLVPGQFVGIPA